MANEARGSNVVSDPYRTVFGYIKTKWGKLGALKRKYLGNTAAAATDATDDEADSTGASAGGV